MNYLKNILFLASLLLLCSCSEKEIESISESLGKPDVPTDIQTEEIPGGVTLSYRLPEAKDILAVKCVYTLTNGKKYETMSSFYNNMLTVEGFVDTEEHEVQLYTVNRAQELSDPVTVRFRPLEAPIAKVEKQMQIDRDFGGTQYRWQNVDRANLSMEFITTDSAGIMRAARIISTNTKDGIFSLRGYESKPRFFAVLIRDGFGNVSDTIFPINAKTGQREEITPIFEKKLDKKKIVIMGLENDCPWNAFGSSENGMIDDDLNSISHSPQNSMPSVVTFNLGVKAKISRVVIHQRFYDNHYYNWGNPVTFDLYGRDEAPSRSGSWNEWPFIEACTIVKPSGLPVNQESDEDIIEAQAGHSFSFGLDLPSLQYIRMKFTKTWGALPAVHIAEITFYGNDGTGEE